MRKIVKLGRVIAISMIVAGGLTACGGMFSADKPLTEDDVLLGQEGKTMWESGLQYVKIAARSAGGTASDHPETLSSDQMKTLLQSLTVIQSKLFKKTEEPLFARSELQILGAAISSGLSQAASNEDVTFVSIGTHRGAIAKERKSTTGRVFITDGRLNIIFGLVHEIYSDKDLATGQEIDRRLNPLLPGKRSFDSKPNVRVALEKGQSYYIDPETGKERNDWIVMDIATVLLAAEERKSADSGTVSPQLLEDVARSKQEAINLRKDVSSMKEIIFEMSGELDRLKKEISTLKK